MVVLFERLHRHKIAKISKAQKHNQYKFHICPDASEH
jgi:hypothetical protein